MSTRIEVSTRQKESLRRAVDSPRWFVNEPLWSFLVASLIAETPERHVALFTGRTRTIPAEGSVSLEAEPISTRSGTVEGNTVLDIAFGHVTRRRLPRPELGTIEDTLAGVTYGPQTDDAWVCFVEAKCLSDCGYRVTHDPLRNQLTRVIENLLCFQDSGQHPRELFFALLTPRVFKETPTARLYGYKIRDYENRQAIAADIAACGLDRRGTRGYGYPDIESRLQHLEQPRWVTIEEVLAAAGIGDGLDIVNRTGDLEPIRAEILRRLHA